MASIAATIEQGRRAVLAHERAMTIALLEEYSFAWGRIERELITITGQIEAAIARGETVDGVWLGRQRWWREVQEDIEREMARFSESATARLVSAQSGAVNIASSVANGVYAATSQPFPGIVHSGAMEHWVSALQSGSPVRRVVDRYGADVSGTIRTRISEGIGSGRNNRAIVRDLVRELGEDIPEYKLSLITRTEIHRSYRGASQALFEPLRERGVITGYVWLSGLGPRVCAACLALHGQTFTEYQMTQHPACRCTQRPLANPALLRHASGYRGTTGEAWLRTQPEKVQKHILQTPGRYKLWQSGTPLSEMVTYREDAVWGRTIGVKPMRDIIREKKEAA